MTTNKTTARIVRGTRRMTVPVPDTDTIEFSIAGTWRDASDDPDATAVTLRCAAHDGRTGSYRLTKDVTFRLPPKTVQVQLEVLNSSDRVNLKVTLSPYIAPPQKPKAPAHVRLGDTRIGHRTFPFGTVNAQSWPQ